MTGVLILKVFSEKMQIGRNSAYRILHNTYRNASVTWNLDMLNRRHHEIEKFYTYASKVPCHPPLIQGGSWVFGN